MANTTIPQLPQAVTLSANDLLLLSQADGVTRKALVSQLTNLLPSEFDDITVSDLASVGRLTVADGPVSLPNNSVPAASLPAPLVPLASVTPAADTISYFTGSGTASTTALTSFARTLLAGTSAAAMLTTLGALATNGDASSLTITPYGGTVPILLTKAAATYDARAFGVKADGTTDDWAALNAALDAIDALGGGFLILPVGVISVSDTLTIGNGSNSQQSTKHHGIVIVGQGSGTGSEVSNVEISGATRIVYNGTTSTSKAVIQFAGPLHSVGLINVTLDANSKAGIGQLNCHITQGRFDRVVVKNFTSAGYYLTTRTGFPTGVAYGNADNTFQQCYAFGAASSTADGIVLTSGVSTATTLAGNPDSARNIFTGGTIFYGGASGSAGCRVSGADNNLLQEVVFLPTGSNTGGNSFYFTQWPGSTAFPLENAFINCTGIQGIGGLSGTGKNIFWPLPTSDGVTQPLSDTNIISLTYGGSMANVRALFADGSAGAPAMSFAQETVSGFYRKASNVITAAISSTDVFDIRANEIRGPAATSGAGVTGYAGSTHIYSMTRSSNDARIAGFGSVIIATGATSGPTSGTNWFQVSNAGVVSHNAGTNTIVDASSHLCLRSYTFATLPSASGAVKGVWVSDRNKPAWASGSSWYYADGTVAS
ncbi:hypothetical protein ABNQ39_00195 (plasmid) [Azospirillum sp. A26]|uniref:hypothetical protein n=1 Tax=Azospirillum sp. A26 TaxID=3160607 RepID=UPI00366B0C5D